MKNTDVPFAVPLSLTRIILLKTLSLAFVIFFPCCALPQVSSEGASLNTKILQSCKDGQRNPSFTGFPFRPGLQLVADQSQNRDFPMRLWSVEVRHGDKDITFRLPRFPVPSGLVEETPPGLETKVDPREATHAASAHGEPSVYFVYLYQGRAMHLDAEGDSIHTFKPYSFGVLIDGWLRVPSSADAGASSKLFLVESIGYKKLSRNEYGGPMGLVRGDLRYIDGCTDNLLLPPTIKGDPCLNSLHFHPGINQTPHTHPSDRIGVVVHGEGTCITPFGNVPLYTGQMFIIHHRTGEKALGLDGHMHDVGVHSFATPPDKGLVVIAWHPDSDFGPEDLDHPMINRTIIPGNELPANHPENARYRSSARCSRGL